MSNKRPLALVTGGAGALGSAIAAALVRMGGGLRLRIGMQQRWNLLDKDWGR